MAAPIDRWWTPFMAEQALDVMIQATTLRWDNPNPMRQPIRAQEFMALIHDQARRTFQARDQLRRSIELTNFNFDVRGANVARQEANANLQRANELVIFWNQMRRSAYSRLQWIRHLRSMRTPWRTPMFPGWFD